MSFDGLHTSYSLVLVSALSNVTVTVKHSSFTVAAYLVVIASVVVFYVLNYEVYSNSDLGASAIFFIYPPFAFYRGLFLMYFSCTFERCPDWGDWAGSPQLIAITVILYVEAVLYMPLAIYLDEVVPREFGVPRHPLFPLHAVVNFFKQRFNKTEEYAKSEAISLMVAGSADELRIEEEKDVVRERERVYRREFSSECPIVIQDLHKKYDSAKVRWSKQARNCCFGSCMLGWMDNFARFLGHGRKRDDNLSFPTDCRAFTVSCCGRGRVSWSSGT